MQKLQEELKSRTVEATVGGGVLTIVMSGEKKVESVHIDPSVVDPDDMEMLEDLVVAAVNEASQKVDDMMAQEMGKITGGMKLPGMF
jgi:DNA-binding YbaB/EbfC family protein